MKGNYSSSSRDSRSQIRGKRRKTNLILNLLIGLVILLIIFVSVKVFFWGNDEETAGNKVENHEAETAQKNELTDKVQTDPDSETKSKGESEQKDSGIKEEDKTNTETKPDSPEKQDPIPANEEDAVVTTGGTGENVKKTIENPSWQPIGTTQTGEHYSVYDADSVDWTEMLQAMSYATGIGQDNMTIWFLGNNGHNKSVGTISSKDQKGKYRVYIEWVDGQGWKPTKVEELNE